MASHKELSKIEPKAGPLYHHLRILGPLIAKDEHRRYYLTDLGRRAVDILLERYFFLLDRGLSRLLLRREFERLTPAKTIFCVLCLATTCLAWLRVKDFIVLLVAVLPICAESPLPALSVLGSWLASSITALGLTRLVFRRTASLRDVALRTAFSYIFLSPLSLFSPSVMGYILLFACQVLLLVYFTSMLSVGARLWMRRSLAVTLLLHYAAILAYILLQR